MATVGGGEGGWGDLHCLPQESSLQLSVSLALRLGRRRRLHLPPGVGDSPGEVCEGRSVRCHQLVVTNTCLQAGTMEKLVESLASDTGELESTYINVFLATYRTFASAKQVLNLLTER